jgi:hypothetical protein
MCACTTTRVAVRGDELRAHLPDLRATGTATVATETMIDDATTGAAGREQIRLAQRVTLAGQASALSELATGCPDGPPDHPEDCAFSLYHHDPFVLRSDRRVDPGGVALGALVAGLFVGYGAMAYCAWNCSGTKSDLSFVGLGITSVLSIVFAIHQHRHD